MKYLNTIPDFPRALADNLASNFGIETAEAFYGHAVQDPEGMRQALQVSRQEVDRLLRIAEGHLDPRFVARAGEKPETHRRGVIAPERPRKGK